IPFGVINRLGTRRREVTVQSSVDSGRWCELGGVVRQNADRRADHIANASTDRTSCWPSDDVADSSELQRLRHGTAHARELFHTAVNRRGVTGARKNADADTVRPATTVGTGGGSRLLPLCGSARL